MHAVDLKQFGANKARISIKADIFVVLYLYGCWYMYLHKTNFECSKNYLIYKFMYVYLNYNYTLISLQVSTQDHVLDVLVTGIADTT